MTILNLFLFFLRISSLTIGGGYAMIAVIHNEIKKFNIIDEKEFFEILTISQTIPGPIIFNFSFLFGKRVLGWKGAIVSIFGVLIPPFLSIVFVAYFFLKFSNNKIINSILKGAFASSMGLLLGMILKNLMVIKYDLVVIGLLILGFFLHFLIHINILIIFVFDILIYFIYRKYIKND